MTIAIFVKNLTSGGAEKQSVLLAKELSKFYNVHYLIFNREKIHEKYINSLKETNSIIIKSFEGFWIKRFVELVKYQKTNEISFVFSYLTGANMTASIASVFAKNKVYVGLRNARLPFAKLWLDRIATNMFSKGAVANCYSGRDNFISHGFKKEKIYVIHNCFDVVVSPPKIPHTNIKIITVGRFVPQKDYETVIHTFAVLNKTVQNTELHIVGYGELERNVREWVAKYDVVDNTYIHINPNNISELLNTSDIYLSTSLFEGTSNSIMEAMNAELPIVATNVGDNAFLVHEGKNGFLCPVKDCNSISNALKVLVNSKVMRDKFGKEGKQLLQNDFSVEVFSEKYRSLIEHVE